MSSRPRSRWYFIFQKSFPITANFLIVNYVICLVHMHKILYNIELVITVERMRVIPTWNKMSPPHRVSERRCLSFWRSQGSDSPTVIQDIQTAGLSRNFLPNWLYYLSCYVLRIHSSLYIRMDLLSLRQRGFLNCMLLLY